MMKNPFISFVLVGAVALLAGCSQTQLTTQSEIDQTLEIAGDTETNNQVLGETMENTIDSSTGDHLILRTSKGDITLKLYPEAAPNTVENFKTKADEDYYKDLTFHRVEDWVIQGGDPEGTGAGGGQMPTELNDIPFSTGSLGVARGGNIQVSNDSQFFICTQDCGWLTGQYTNFGEVVQGMDVVMAITKGDTITGLEVANNE